MVPGISQDIMNTMGASGAMGAGGASQMVQSDHIAGTGKKEPANVANARSRASEASQPDGGKVTKKEEKK